MKQLDRLLFEQGGDCFFCKQPLAKADASIEHLLAQANGGTNAEENVVACCKAINTLLSNKPLKEKFAILLRQKQGVQCPDKVATAEPAKFQPAPKPSTPQSSAKPAPQRPAVQQSRPAAKKALSVAEISSAGILALSPPSPTARSSATVTCPTCRHTVQSAVGQVDYVCPHCRGAFRY
jgi:hypothetical protein